LLRAACCATPLSAFRCRGAALRCARQIDAPPSIFAR